MPYKDKQKRRDYHNAYNRRWRKLPHVRQRRKISALKTTLKREYGLSLEEYESLSKAQDGLCAACRRKCVQYPRLSVDHCHATGKVRGLLCTKCNVALGMLDEDPKIIAALLKYLFEANP